MKKPEFNFINVESLLHIQLRMEEVPLNQIKISKFSLYLPKWMLDDRHVKCPSYSLHIDPDNKLLLIKPNPEGKYLFTRKLKSGLTMSGIFRCRKIIVDFLGQGDEARTFACKWNAKYAGFIVDFKNPLAEE